MNEIIAAAIGAIAGISSTVLLIFQENIKSGTSDLWMILIRRTPRKKTVERTSRYRRSTSNFIKEELKKEGINVENISVTDDFSAADLEIFCHNVYCPTIPQSKLHNLISEARSAAFTVKYATPKGDEKTVEISKIKFPGIKPWDIYFHDLLKNLRVGDITDLDILNVGIGNGCAEAKIFERCKSLKAVDVSEVALRYAHDNYLPNMTYFVDSAEDLRHIQTSSVDLYVSLRVYQSTLLDRKMALHEAYRVLLLEGVVIISIPIMYLKEDGEVLKGLIPSGSTEPKMEYAESMVSRVEQLLNTLNFKNIGIDRLSPFEIFVYGRR